MAKAISISLSKFTASVQAAVKAAMEQHPKFKGDVPNSITISYLIRGIPAPEAIVSKVTVGEIQAFAADIAAHIGRAHPEAMGPTPHEAVVLAVGRHVIVGIPPAIANVIEIER